MATYPTDLTIGYGSKRSIRTGRMSDEDGDGISRVRKLHPDRYDFEIVHPALNTTDFATFIAFHTARTADNASFDFYWIDGLPYPATFSEPPFTEEVVGPNLTTVRVMLKAAE